MKKVTVALTGASGSIYAEYLCRYLVGYVDRIYLITSSTGLQVAAHELRKIKKSSIILKAFQGALDESDASIIKVFKSENLFAPIASGTSCPDHMVIVPCSMGSLARISHGFSSNLVERSADVILKQNKQLILVPREAPLSSIHLENMLRLSQMGARIVPPAPGFYHHPNSMDDLINFVVGKILDELEVEHKLSPKWNEVQV